MKTHHDRTRHPARRAGFTLVELMIVAVVLAVLFGSVAVVSRSNERAYQTGTTAALLEQQTAAAMEKLVAELQMGIRSSVSVDPGADGADSITYSLADGFAGSSVIESPPRSLTIEYADGELNDGLDNNGNGLVDEGQIVLTEDIGSTNRARVITRWVPELFVGETVDGLDNNGNGVADERGFHITREGDTYVLLLMLQRRDAQGAVLTRTARSAVRMRN